jgi:hypothetical protein
MYTIYSHTVLDYLPTIMDSLGFEKIDAVRQKTNPGWPLDGISLLPAIRAITSPAADATTTDAAAATTATSLSAGGVGGSGSGDDGAGSSGDGISDGMFGAGLVRMAPLGWVTQHALGGKVVGPGHATMQKAWMLGELKLYANRSSDPANFTYYLFNIR